MEYLEYFKRCLNTDYIYKLDWYFSVFLNSTKDNNYVRRKDNTTDVNLNGEWITIVDSRKDSPLLLFSDKLSLNKEQVPNLKQNIETTIGRVIFNYIILVRNFGDKIEFINTKTSIGDIERDIAKLLAKDIVLTSEYLRFTDACSFIEQLSPITNISATYKNILPPPNLDKIKQQLYKKFDAEYGKNWRSDRLRVVQFQEELKKVDEEWLKDDPSNGKLITGKIKNNARVKMYLTVGPEVGFNKDGSKTTFIENSLLDQYPDDKEKLAALFNSARVGSYDRGKETAKGGVASKDVLRGLSSYRIVKGDCKSKEGKTLLVTKDNVNSLLGRYLIQGNTIVEITNPNAWLGKTITIRSPMYCIHPAPDYCSTCCGKLLENSPNAISTIGAAITGKIMYVSMKTMHNSQVSIKNVDIQDIIE